MEVRSYKFGAGIKLSFLTQEGQQYHTVIFKNTFYFSFAQNLSVEANYNVKAIIKQGEEKHFLVDIFNMHNASE